MIPETISLSGIASLNMRFNDLVPTAHIARGMESAEKNDYWAAIEEVSMEKG